jgi:transcriptional regulator with XRE-family HTH domain
MPIHPLALQLRAKKLGVLIRDARLARGRTLEECAAELGISPELFEAYEYGEASPSLPQVEWLAYTLGVPLDHFWGDQSLSEQPAANGRPDPTDVLEVRQRVIGALIRKARQDARVSPAALAAAVHIAPEELEAIELGEQIAPLPLLEALSGALNHSIREFQDQHGPVGVWWSQQKAVTGFLDLPPDLQGFIGKPINRPYLELAVRLSEMSVDRLRAVAEGLLEITY